MDFPALRARAHISARWRMLWITGLSALWITWLMPLWITGFALWITRAGLAVDYVADATGDYAPGGAVDFPALRGRQFTAGGERSVTPGKRVIIKSPSRGRGRGVGICDRTHHLSLAANAGRAELARYTLRVPTLTGGNARFTRSPPAVNCRPFRACEFTSSYPHLAVLWITLRCGLEDYG